MNKLKIGKVLSNLDMDIEDIVKKNDPAIDLDIEILE